MKESRLNLRVHTERQDKLRRIALKKKKTMTQMVEDWIDQLEETE